MEPLNSTHHERKAWYKVGGHRFSVVNPAIITREPKKNPAINPIVIRYLFALSLAWQIANVVIIVLADVAQANQHNKFDIGVSVMLGFQGIHIVLVAATSIKLCKQVIHRTASPMFVVQSFLSTLMLYAGICTLFIRVDPNCFSGFEGYSVRGFGTVEIFISFLYFSCATMTTVGFGDIVPTTWFTQLIVTSEMLLSVTYSVVIFAQGLSHFNNPLLLEPTRNVHDDSDDDSETHPLSV